MLTFSAKAGQATFSWADGPMKAEWTLKTGATEDEIMQVLASMARFVRAQPAGAQVIDLPLHVVPDPPSYGGGLTPPPATPPTTMTWTPAVKPKPLSDSVEAAAGNGFELIPPDELED